VHSNFLGQIKQSEQAQDSSYNYDFVLSFLCELSNFRMARSEQHPIIALHFLMLVPSCWPQHWANVCTGNNACSLSTPLLLHLRLSSDCTIQSFGYCSAQCARLGSACLASFLKSEQLLYLLVSNPHLDHVHICILHASPHATPAWISHWAHWEFLHGNSCSLGCASAVMICMPLAFLSIKLDRFQLS